MTDEVFINNIRKGAVKELARAISLVANNVAGYDKLLEALTPLNVPVVGITGPPGAGKSTLADKIIGELVKQGKTLAVLCVDPSSTFTQGAILGDRIRMSEWYTNPNVFIRSLATRGSLGGLPPMAEEIIQLVSAAAFDYIFIETVGVGQNEIEIVSLADLTIVVLVPESGDDIQIMKAGLMEIADIFVVNKCDRPGADLFARDIQSMLFHSPFPESQKKKVLKTIASTNKGVGDLVKEIINYFSQELFLHQR